MENNTAEDMVFNEQQTDLFGNKDVLIVTEETKDCLIGTTKWVKFLAVLTCILLAICLLFGLSMAYGLTSSLSALEAMGSSLGSSAVYGGTSIIFTFGLMALFILYPTLRMFKYSSKTRAAVANDDDDTLAEGFEEMRKFFKYIEWITALCLMFVGVILIFGIITAVTTMHWF